MWINTKVIPPIEETFYFVKWESEHGKQKGERFVSIGYWDGYEFLRVQSCEEHPQVDATFNYIGKVVAWRPIIYPDIKE